MNGGDGGSDRPQGFARRTASSAPSTVAFGPQPVRRFTGPAHLRLCPHWLRLPPPTPIFRHKKTGTRPVSLCLWWRWRVTIHYHGKSKIDYLDKTGTAPSLSLINISKFIHQFLSQWVSSEYVFSLHKQDIRFHLLLYV